MKGSRIFMILIGLATSCLLAYAILSRTSGPSEAPPFNPDTMENTQDMSNTPPASADPSQPTETPVPAQSDPGTATPNAYQQYGIHWFSGFEYGDLREWENKHGEFIRQGSSPYYQIVSNPVLNGRLAAGLTIDTSTSDKAQSAYLFYYDNPPEAWYSSWFFIPQDTRPQGWWIIMQWKSTYNGNSDHSLPLWVLVLDEIPGSEDFEMKLVYRPDSNAEKKVYENTTITIPRNEWFHISAYYKKSLDQNGAMAVFINGQQLFSLQNIHTTLSDNTLYWSINHYADEMLPYPSTIYVDDVIISQQRIPPEFRLP